MSLVPTQADTVALAVMRLSFFDWLAVGLAGHNEPVSCLTRDLVLEEGGHAQASLFGGGRVPMRSAALANGACSHALDYDDTHFAHIGHPSVAVLPAAVAVGEAQGAALAEVLDAALAGCEASVRIGLLLGRGHYQIGFHQTGTAGAFGAAWAAACLLGASETDMGHALGLVSTRAGGLKSQFGTMGKPFNAGAAASNGVEAAWLAHRGFLSNPEALSGINGFLETHHADGSSTQPSGWLMRDVRHKYHACCHGLHAVLEALEGLKPMNPMEVQSIKVVTHPRWMSVCNIQAPKTGLEAKFSYRAVIALSLLGYSTAALESFRDTHCHDPQVISLYNKVSVVADASVPETGARLVVKMSDQVLEADFDLEAATTLEVRAEKLRRKVSALLGDAKATLLWEAVQGEDLSAITHLMRGS